MALARLCSSDLPTQRDPTLTPSSSLTAAPTHKPRPVLAALHCPAARLFATIPRSYPPPTKSEPHKASRQRRTSLDTQGLFHFFASATQPIVRAACTCHRPCRSLLHLLAPWSWLLLILITIHQRFCSCSTTSRSSPSCHSSSTTPRRVD